MTWTFAESLRAARALLDGNYDWNRAEISMTYLGPQIGWISAVNRVELKGHVERFAVEFSVGTYEDLVKE